MDRIMEQKIEKFAELVAVVIHLIGTALITGFFLTQAFMFPILKNEFVHSHPWRITAVNVMGVLYLFFQYWIITSHIRIHKKKIGDLEAQVLALKTRDN